MEYLLLALKYFLYSTIGLLLLFIFVMKLQQFANGKPKWVRTILILGFWKQIGAGILWDAFYHYTWGTLLFLDLPAKDEYLLTQRLKRYLAAGPIDEPWRWYLAYKICLLIEKIDPEHCG